MITTQNQIKEATYRQATRGGFLSDILWKIKQKDFIKQNQLKQQRNR